MNQIHDYARRGETTKDAQERTAEGVAPLKRFDLVQAVAEANQHDRYAVLAEHENRLQQHFRNMEMAEVNRQAGDGGVDQRQAKNLAPVAAAVQNINAQRILQKR